MALKQKKNDWFGPRLKQFREQARLTQGQIAEQMEISERQYRQWEAGHAEPPLHKLPALARNLKVQPGMFFPQSDDWPALLCDCPSKAGAALIGIEAGMEKVLTEVRDLRRSCS